MSGTLTYVLVLIFSNLSGATVPGYDSVASCQAAGQAAMKSGMRAAYCIPGPVEAKR